MESIVYVVETQNGETATFTETEMRDGMDDIGGDVKSIVKKYKLHHKKGKTFCMTLFTDAHLEISADEYIEHYRNLPADNYGHNVFSKINKRIVEMFN